MFKDVLRNIVERTEGAVAGLLMDTSGISVESFAKPNGSFDITTVGVEFSVIVGAVRRAAQMLEAGPPQELAVTTDQMTILIRLIDESYFIVLALEPNGNFGKGRYLMRASMPELLSEL